MADPYATRQPDLSGRPEGPPPWEGEVTARGGSLIDPAGGFDPAAAFAVVPCCGIGSLAPVARVEPPMAVLLWLEHAAERRDAAAANDLLARLAAYDGAILAVKHGSVGGPSDRGGCSEAAPELIAAVLDRRDDVGWERDPDFDYLVPGSVPGVDDPAARVLVPRLLYADNGRVYEHAGLVADKKRERHEVVAGLADLDPRSGRRRDGRPS